MKFKKVTAWVLTLCLIISAVQCGLISSVSAGSVSDFTDYAAYGEQISDSLSKVVWHDDGVHAYDNLAEQSGNSFLWGYGSLIEGLGQQVKYDPLNGDAVAEYKKALNNVLQYEATGLYEKYDIPEEDYLAMNCLPNSINAEVFYDDDIWIQKEFLNAYNTLGNPEYLDYARRMMNYIYRGWDDEFGGGIYWKDTGYGGGTSPKNTCINAPATMASARMYIATGEQSYLDWAKKIYRWTKDTFLDPDDKVLWDNIGYDGNGNVRVDKAKYTYNSGCFISAAALLYQITGETVYLEDAKATAKGAYERWLSEKYIDELGENGYIWGQDHTWFNSSMVEGFYLLSRSDSDETYMNSALSSLAVACLTRAPSDAGWIHNNWHNSGNISLSDVSVLQQSATVRTLFILAQYIDEKPDPESAINAISGFTAGTDEYNTAVKTALTAYYGAGAANRAEVTNSAALDAALNTALGEDTAAAVNSLINQINKFYVVTYKTEAQLLSIKAAYDALAENAKAYVVNCDVLTSLIDYQQQTFDLFNLTVSGWKSGASTPWLENTTVDGQTATRDAVVDEVWYQYRARAYKMGTISGNRELESYSGIVGLQMDAQPNDNVYNPWGHANRRWSFVTVPYSGMSFSITGYFGNAYPLPIGNSFTYNGNVYQTYMNTVKYYADTPIVAGGSVEMNEYAFHPGYDGTKEMDSGTFKYSYAKFGQDNKWADGTLGLATGNVVSYNDGAFFYQKYDSPDGSSYLVNTPERIAAVSAVETSAAAYETTLAENRAFVISGDLAKAFIALASGGSARFAITGAPLYQESGGIMIFENGSLTADGFTSDEERLNAVSAVNNAILAIPQPSDITLDDEPQIVSARADYDTLREEWKPYVSTLDKLTVAEERIAALKQEVIDRAAAAPVSEAIAALGEITLTSREAVEAALSAYDALNEQAKTYVENYNLLTDARIKIAALFGDIDYINAELAALGEVTYRNGPAVRIMRAKYDGLNDEQKTYITDYAKLTDAEAVLDEAYNNFSFTVNGWSTAKATPWMDTVSEEAQAATRSAMEDEVKYQYVMNGYNVGIKIGGSKNVGNYSDYISIQTEDRPNDNVGNPWGDANRRWSNVGSPFSGTAFSICGYFSRYFQYQAPLGDSFTYNGKVYQQFMGNCFYYNETPIVEGGTVDLQKVGSYPGYDGKADITANTFRYAYSEYAQQNKWNGKTLGVPSGNAVSGEGYVYQKFEGPDGAAYLLTTDERIAAVDTADETTIKANAPYVITGDMAAVLAALGDNPFSVTGLPVYEKGSEFEFENGVLNGERFYAAEGNEQDIVDRMVVDISNGMITETDNTGRLNITWNCKIYTGEFVDLSANLINKTGIKILSYGVYFGTSEDEIKALMSGDSARAKQLVIDSAENHAGADDIDMYTMFGFRLKNVPKSAERTAMFYLEYELNGKTVLLFSTADSVTAYIE